MISEAIAKKYGREYLLRQLAEEAGELTQAALKLVRVWNMETPVTEAQARDKLVEEMSDVLLMLRYVRDEVLTSAESMRVTDTMYDKSVRMYKRMILGEANAK